MSSIADWKLRQREGEEKKKTVVRVTGIKTMVNDLTISSVTFNNIF